MKLAITQSYGPRQGIDFLKQTYVHFFTALEVALIPVSNALPDPAATVEALGADGLILSGGGDVSPARYGASNAGSREITRDRDRTEWALLNWAVTRGKPVIGICRGFQVINVYFGGALVQDIPAQIPGACQHHETEHPVAVTHAALAGALGARTLPVNSFHHQAVTADRLAPDLEALALSEADGVIEALWHRSLPVFGVQWHPERMTPFAQADGWLVRAALDGSLWSLRG